jgi:hypothetical protein
MLESDPHDVRLVLSSDRLRAEALDSLVRDLLNDLAELDGLTVEPAARHPARGERAADVGLVGQIVLTFISAGAATALISCLKAYVERDRTLRLRFKRSDGTELELEGKHFEPKTVDATMRALKRLMPDARP